MSPEASAIASTKSLTKYPSGSARELWTISFPLMLSLMSASLMLFFDRLFLARYSIEALNASTNASVLAAAIQFAFISTSCIAEVMVGRYNGAGKFERLGQPVWQMIWFSLMSAAIFFPIGWFLSSLLFHGSPYADLEIHYFEYLMLFGPVFCLSGALSSFYIGQGKVLFVTLTVIIANAINVGLDLLLIFGWEPFIPSIGIVGAAVATGIAQTLQCIILFISFIRRRNRQRFGTGNFRFNKLLFFRCLKIGVPNATAHSLEVFAWAVFFRMMTTVSEEHITVVAISQSIFFLFTFINEGISKGATAIAANMIGARQWSLVWKLFTSGVKIYLVLFVLTGFVLVGNPSVLIQWFLPEGGDVSHLEISALVESACFWVWIFFFFDGINWLVIGLLTAAGDTKFVLKTGGTTVWLFAVLPIYIFVVLLGHKADTAWAITSVYGFLTASIFFLRFRSEKWKEAALSSS